MEENKAQAKAAQEKQEQLMRELGESKQTTATLQSKVPFASYPHILMKPYMGVMQTDRLLSSILSFFVQVNELEKDVERKDQELKSEKEKVDEQKKNFNEDMRRKEEEIKVLPCRCCGSVPNSCDISRSDLADPTRACSADDQRDDAETAQRQ